MLFPNIQMGWPQRLAALLLLAFAAQCVWVISQQPVNSSDYRWALCGREMWEHHQKLPGYYTSCGNIPDGVLAYRAAAAPLSLAIALDRERHEAGVWEYGSTKNWTKYAIRLPFVLFGVWLGGALWWVTRRLFGDGAYIALSLYCFSPHIIAVSIVPSPEILAAWGLFGLVFTAIGVAHTLYAPRRKWYKRIVLLGIALAVTAASHAAAALIGLLFAAAFLLYLAPAKRRPALLILVSASIIAEFMLWGLYSFNGDAMSYWFHGRAATLEVTWHSIRMLASSVPDAGVTVFLAIALAALASFKRSRYFGNIAPLAVAMLLLVLDSTDGKSLPWLWALPFIFAFIGGVFADLIETRQRKQFVVVAVVLSATNAVLCLMVLPAIASGSVGMWLR